MSRSYTQEEWDQSAKERRKLALRLGLVKRVPLDQQLYKSGFKKTLLRERYGHYGQPGTETTDCRESQ